MPIWLADSEVGPAFVERCTLTVIDRYIIRSFLGGYSVLMFVGIGLYILSDLLFNFDEFTENATLPVGAVLAAIADYYWYNIPLYFSQLNGPVMAMAGAFALGLMLKGNELAPLITAGVPLPRLAAPILGAALVIVIVWMANREILMPRIAGKIARSHDDLTGTRTQAVHCARDERNVILTAARFYARDGGLAKVLLIEPDDAGRPVSLIQADSADYDASRGVWRLSNGFRVAMGDPAADEGLGRGIRREPLVEYAFGLTPAQVLLQQSGQWADLMSLAQMNELLSTGNLPNRAAVVHSRDGRFMQPLLQWILLALAVPAFLCRAPTTVVSAGGKALLMCGALFFAAFVMQTLSGEDMLTRFATASPVIIFGSLAVYKLASVRT
ncbi:putative permease YjgP/YjgQ family protein [Phycisphaerae bacterium RAS1]|nr:putative permease YjgP/YjgQ family protein [Phycisphaerae bacterium RAS1]